MRLGVTECRSNRQPALDLVRFDHAADRRTARIKVMGAAMTQSGRTKLRPVVSVASILERELGSILAGWLKRVNLIPDVTKVALSDADRTGYLPQLFRDLISRLRLDRAAEPPFSTTAAEHGKTRFAQGYSVAMLVEESRIFEVTTFGTLHAHQGQLDQNEVLLDVITIADEADRQLTQSVSSFAAAQAVFSLAVRVPMARNLGGSS
jgi:hypothetical protein